jgi:hypothetical protein
MGGVMRLANTLVAVGVAVLGGYAIGLVSELETVLLAGLGCLVGLAFGLRAAPHAQRRLLSPAVACFVIGGALGLTVARLPLEQSLASAVRSVVLNPVIVVGFAVGARLSWACLRWAARFQPAAPSAASHPAPQPAGTTAAGSR